MSENIIKSYKGFDKDMQCRDFQYEVGKEYNMDGEIEYCNRGFHACKSPLEVWVTTTARMDDMGLIKNDED